MPKKLKFSHLESLFVRTGADENDKNSWSYGTYSMDSGDGDKENDPTVIYIVFDYWSGGKGPVDFAEVKSSEYNKSRLLSAGEYSEKFEYFPPAFEKRQMVSLEVDGVWGVGDVFRKESRAKKGDKNASSLADYYVQLREPVHKSFRIEFPEVQDRLKTIKDAIKDPSTNIKDIYSFDEGGHGIVETLIVHNTARDEVNVEPLIWDADIAKYSQDWADTLAKNGAPLTPKDHRSKQNSKTEAYPSDLDYEKNYAGENIYHISTDGINVADAPLQWIGLEGNGEKANYLQQVEQEDNYNFEHPSKYGVYGHYTAMVWKDTKRVGCGIATSKDGKGTWIVCNYSPGGNINRPPTQPYPTPVEDQNQVKVNIPFKRFIPDSKSHNLTFVTKPGKNYKVEITPTAIYENEIFVKDENGEKKKKKINIGGDIVAKLDDEGKHTSQDRKAITLSIPSSNASKFHRISIRNKDASNPTVYELLVTVTNEVVEADAPDEPDAVREKAAKYPDALVVKVDKYKDREVKAGKKITRFIFMPIKGHRYKIVMDPEKHLDAGLALNGDWSNQYKRGEKWGKGSTESLESTNEMSNEPIIIEVRGFDDSEQGKFTLTIIDLDDKGGGEEPARERTLELGDYPSLIAGTYTFETEDDIDYLIKVSRTTWVDHGYRLIINDINVNTKRLLKTQEHQSIYHSNGNDLVIKIEESGEESKYRISVTKKD